MLIFIGMKLYLTIHKYESIEPIVQLLHIKEQNKHESANITD